ncbi:GMC family oxidoreductase N-terminal domain-containing protein [Amycolatopsis carbonis]|uniref:GMC family oxidoreductase N-terminal domain-containing protein n=1 Tax=Amycolatopsis carbonis TaxID=715471 RepID=A0A9Y2IP33_9PSEU|nr:GMC family oxidoreductase N-terminal domain-containing protein [Amycolatopsis sp. 2-15]WIX83677.1 GMC family oxidoreductase N-terminal domain-containing protein [Amycolatopsis sp. 2-15]
MSARYDYVVVGGGTAGCVVAARLSEDTDSRVLLLESGGPDSKAEISDPPAWPSVWGTEVDYGYRTVPQAGTGGAAHDWPRGHTLGGSHSINAMVHLRGHRGDFDQWARMGCTGWDYDSVLPYFRRMESVPGRDARFRGTDGPLRPAPSAAPNPLSQVFVDAAVAAGHPRADDFNGADGEGAGWHDLSIADGMRQSTAAAYLRPIRDARPNLTVATGARAHRLLFDADQCTGVEYRQDGAGHTVYADREVILSAGTVDSPRLLLLSGVGPAADLEYAGVDVVHDLPGVGRNLHDHPLCNVVYEAAQPIPPGNTNHAETSMVWRSDPSLTGPDMQLMFMHVPFGPPALPAPPNSFTFGLATVPQARGAVRIAGPDPSAQPLIDPNYLGAERDVLRLVDAVAVAREIAAAHPFDAWRGKELHPGPDARDQHSLREFVTRATGTYFHPVGTCAMGTGPGAVVDLDLRLRGVRGLRVADASVMPRIVCVNTNAATIMIGEKAADLVRGREVAGSVS